VKTLSPADRRALKARAHPLSPVVSIAGKGLTPSVLAEIDTCLTAHELIKIRVYGSERDDREAFLAQVCQELHAAPVQHIGNILIVFREKPQEEPAPVAKLPAKKPARKPAWGMKAVDKPISKIKAAKTGQRRKIEYGQLRNTRTSAVKKRSPGVR
jgi:putative YhbY family RNA-binding protein